MAKIQGFRLKHRVATFFRTRSTSCNHRSDRPTGRKSSLSRLFHCLKKKTMSLCFSSKPSISQKRGYVPLNGDDKLPAVPKGHMVVYVGQNEGCDFHRFMIPVMYFNHPLFGKLLSEAEEEFGFNHPGGITIPCRVSDFESVQNRIAAAGCNGGGRKFLKWTKGL
ncbi:auxin-responsive protein SAUR36-like [Impatiens glandulifera]|uniref:auxin-responsive protein SAUR36-like n=1 Tax=Impatiens glandulifera TaxID=253017 RepID=UPI001FB0A73E|nr:auxin-responsive protein SAUR36-like [Impatiens glandulifera]